MDNMTAHHGLRVANALAHFIDDEALPGTGVRREAFGGDAVQGRVAGRAHREAAGLCTRSASGHGFRAAVQVNACGPDVQAL